MRIYKIVLDTNVLVSAVKSKNGFAFRLLSIIDDKRFKVYLSVPVVLEYETVLKNNISLTKLSEKDIDNILDYLCFIGEERKIFYLWRPHLKDFKDDMFLELAVESGSDFIITFNKKDFTDAGKFNIKTLTPKELLNLIGEKL